MATKLLQDVELSWCFLDPSNPQENFEKKQWSVTATVTKDKAKKFKEAGYIKSLRPVEDADGNETGMYKITIKQNAETAAGKAMRAPNVFTKSEDGVVRPLTGVIIGNGSTGTVSFDTYDWEFKGKKGISMALKNILVTNLIPYEAADAPGSEFGKVDGDEFGSTESPFKDSKDLDLDLDDEDGDF